MPSSNQSGKKGDTSKRGFASMDEQKQREIASKGGHAAHEKGTAHEFTPEEAREAGRKGGEAVSEDRQHMAEIGRKGGEHSHGGGRSAAAGKSSRSEQTGERESKEGKGSDQPAEGGGKSGRKNG